MLKVDVFDANGNRPVQHAVKFSEHEDGESFGSAVLDALEVTGLSVDTAIDLAGAMWAARPVQAPAVAPDDDADDPGSSLEPSTE